MRASLALLALVSTAASAPWGEEVETSLAKGKQNIAARAIGAAVTIPKFKVRQDEGYSDDEGSGSDVEAFSMSEDEGDYSSDEYSDSYGSDYSGDESSGDEYSGDEYSSESEDEGEYQGENPPPGKPAAYAVPSSAYPYSAVMGYGNAPPTGYPLYPTTTPCSEKPVYPTSSVPSYPMSSYPPKQYSVPSYGYSVPPNGYSVPPNGYSVPTNGYSVPPNGYSLPPNGYSMPPNGYSLPPNGYSMPPNGYSLPPNGYSMPPNGYSVKSMAASISNATPTPCVGCVNKPTTASTPCPTSIAKSSMPVYAASTATPCIGCPNNSMASYRPSSTIPMVPTYSAAASNNHPIELILAGAIAIAALA